MKIRMPSHTTVVAYLALFVAVGTGGAYAVDKIGSGEIKRDAVTSAKIDNRTIKGKDVKDDSLRGRQIREASLDLPAPPVVAGQEFGGCDPSSETQIDCGTVGINLAQPGRILAVAGAGQFSNDGAASARCQLQVDGVPAAPGGSAGEFDFDNTDLGAANGFARTVVSGPLEAGLHRVTLACGEFEGDAAIETPTIAAIAIPGS